MSVATNPDAGADVVPVGPSLSMYDPVYLGIDEFGEPVYLELVYRNLLAGGEPGGGKSGLLNVIAAHAALSTDTRLVLFDGKLVELGMWEDVADEFVGPDIAHASGHPAPSADGDEQPVRVATRPEPAQDRPRRRAVGHHRHRR